VKAANAIEQRVVRRVFCGLRHCGGAMQGFQALPAELRVVVVVEAVGELLIERPRHRRVAFFFGETRTPVERGGNFRGIGIERDLIFETLRASSVRPCRKASHAAFQCA
jgi:hypothetical protein